MCLRFEKQLIADTTYESAAAFDVNGNGIFDVVCGEWWYEGPDFRQRHPIGTVPVKGEYYDDFSTIPLDISGNGRLDFISGGMFGETLRWRENPGDPNCEWPEHVIDEPGGIETTRAWDIDGDGGEEIIPNLPNNPLIIYKRNTDAQGRGSGSFTSYTVDDGPQGHGLGCGDIAGNGRMDIVLKKGWFEAPAQPFEEPWTWHPDFDLGSASVPIIVADVNGNGMRDLIVGQSHEYGLSWWEQQLSSEGERIWSENPIDPYNSQYHDLHWLDVDGDGACELVTGKRYRAHCGNDPGADDPYGIYVFKWNGASFTKLPIIFDSPGETTGLGIFSSMADLDGNGRIDLVAPGKDGLYVFWNKN